VRINARAKGYIKQGSFKGSGREVRGAIVRALSEAPQSKSALTKLFPKERASQMEEQIDKLVKEEIIVKKGAVYSLAT
jgi:predicted transcriptional regulator